MTATILPFRFHKHQVRMFPSDNGLSFWAVAKDITDILGYRDAANGLRLVPERHKGTHSVSTLGGTQDMLCVDEAGFYRLVLRSNKPEADPFLEWVTADVLPSIRRHGFYGDPMFDSTGLPMSAQDTDKARRKQMREMKALLLDRDPVMKKVLRYKVAKLTNAEIGTLVGLHRSTVGKLLKRMAAAGLFRFSGQIVPGQSSGKTYDKAKIAPDVVAPLKKADQKNLPFDAPEDR